MSITVGGGVDVMLRFKGLSRTAVSQTLLRTRKAHFLSRSNSVFSRYY